MFRFVATKKAWEFLLSPIPDLRLSHCPFPRISNAVSPRQVILYVRHYCYTLLYIALVGNIIHPRRRFVALPLWEVSNLRDLRSQNSNVRKRLFEVCPTNGLVTSFHQCLDPPAPTGLTESCAKLNTFLFINNNLTIFF